MNFLNKESNDIKEKKEKINTYIQKWNKTNNISI